MFLLTALLGVVLPSAVANAATLLEGGTVIAWNEASQSLEVLRNGSVLVENNTITAVFSGQYNGTLPTNLEVVDVTNDIVSTGFIDTHRHSWQTAMKTLGSNTTLVQYLNFYGTSEQTGTLFTPDDVYIGQLAGLYEALNGGVTTILDHAHCSWSEAHARAALDANLASGIRAAYGYYLGDFPFSNFTFERQAELFRTLTSDQRLVNSPVSLAIAYDSFLNRPQAQKVVDLAREYNISVLSTHTVGGVYGAGLFPSLLESYGFLNTSTAIVFGHGTHITPSEAALLRQYNHYVSVTPESEMHYGHLHPTNHLVLDQSALGVDTHFTFSTDILTQARMWLQSVRKTLYTEVVNRWKIPATNPMSANQAFLLATRNGGLAMRRPDLGVLAVGAKADLVVWNGRSPAMLGWRDPVAAVILHASVGDIKHVVVDGKFVKRNGTLTAQGYPDVQQRFLQSANRIQDVFAALPLPSSEEGEVFEAPIEIDALRGNGTGYGPLYY